MQSLGRAAPSTPSTLTAPSTPAHARNRVARPTSAMRSRHTVTMAASSPETLGTATSRSRKYSLRCLSFMSSLASSRIVTVPDPVSQDVGGQHGDADEQAGKEADPEGVADQVARFGQHVPPRGRGWWWPHAEEAQGGLVEDRVPEDERGLHDVLRRGVGQDMPADDAR